MYSLAATCSKCSSAISCHNAMKLLPNSCMLISWLQKLQATTWKADKIWCMNIISGVERFSLHVFAYKCSVSIYKQSQNVEWRASNSCWNYIRTQNYISSKHFAFWTTKFLFFLQAQSALQQEYFVIQNGCKVLIANILCHLISCVTHYRRKTRTDAVKWIAYNNTRLTASFSAQPG